MMLDRLKGWLGTREVANAAAPTRQAAQASAPQLAELRPVDTVSLTASAPGKPPAAQVAFFPVPPATRPVQGRVGEMNSSDPQFQALLGRLFGDVRVASGRIG